MDGLQLVKK